MIKSAFVLAAGKGERLRPLTDRIPKPLLPVDGVPMLTYVLKNLECLHLDRVVVNAWYHKNLIKDYIRSMSGKFSFELILSEEEELLGTGGGLKKALPLLGEAPFLMLNGDCLWKGDLENFVHSSLKQKDAVSWWLLPAKKDQTEIGTSKGSIVKIGPLWDSGLPAEKTGCFSGIQVFKEIDAAVLPKEGCIIRQYLVPLLNNKAVSIYGHYDGMKLWEDLGTPERYHEFKWK